MGGYVQEVQFDGGNELIVQVAWLSLWLLFYLCLCRCECGVSAQRVEEEDMQFV